jgi:hypothetical protein
VRGALSSDLANEQHPDRAKRVFSRPPRAAGEARRERVAQGREQLQRGMVVVTQESRHRWQRAGQHAQVGDEAIQNGARERVRHAGDDNILKNAAGALQLLFNSGPHAAASIIRNIGRNSQDGV